MIRQNDHGKQAPQATDKIEITREVQSEGTAGANPRAHQWERFNTLIAKGASCDVFEGVIYRRSGTQKAAIKVLRGTCRSDPAEVEAFRQEAEFLTQQAHGNIVNVFDYDVTQGEIAMEVLVESKSNWVSKKQPVATVARMLEEAMAGLAEMHDQRRFHGQLSPGKLLVDERGAVKIIGTPGYYEDKRFCVPQGIRVQAPEYLDSTYGIPGHASDQFQLGMIALQSLLSVRGAEKRVFKGDQSRWITSADELGKDALPTIPDNLARVIRRLVRKNAHERYPSLHDALADLRNAFAADSVPAKSDLAAAADSVIEIESSHLGPSGIPDHQPTPEPSRLERFWLHATDMKWCWRQLQRPRLVVGAVVVLLICTLLWFLSYPTGVAPVDVVVRVTDWLDRPISMADVRVRDAADVPETTSGPRLIFGASTDDDGKAKLRLTPGHHILVINKVGCQPLQRRYFVDNQPFNNRFEIIAQLAAIPTVKVPVRIALKSARPDLFVGRTGKIRIAEDVFDSTATKELTVGDHRIELSMVGHESKEVWLRVEKDATKIEELYELALLPITLTVFSVQAPDQLIAMIGGESTTLQPLDRSGRTFQLNVLPGSDLRLLGTKQGFRKLDSRRTLSADADVWQLEFKPAASPVVMTVLANEIPENVTAFLDGQWVKADDEAYMVPAASGETAILTPFGIRIPPGEHLVEFYDTSQTRVYRRSDVLFHASGGIGTFEAL